MFLHDLFFWTVMVLSGGYCFWNIFECITCVFRMKLPEAAACAVVGLIMFWIHRWAFIKLIPYQTFFS